MADINIYGKLVRPVSTDKIIDVGQINGIEEIIETAQGASKTYVCSATTNPALNSQSEHITISSTLTDIQGNTISVANVKIGETMYITQTDIPDRWVSAKSGTSSYTLSQMETAKVPITSISQNGTQISPVNGNVNLTNLPAKYTHLTGTIATSDWQSSGGGGAWVDGEDLSTWNEGTVIPLPIKSNPSKIGLVLGETYTLTCNFDGTAYTLTATAMDGTPLEIEGDGVICGFSDGESFSFQVFDGINPETEETGLTSSYALGGGGSGFTSFTIGTLTGAGIGGGGGDYTYTLSNNAIKVNSQCTMHINTALPIVKDSKSAGQLVIKTSTQPTASVAYDVEILETSAEGSLIIDNAYLPTIPSIPTDLPQTTGNLQSGNLPISGWTDSDLFLAGTYQKQQTAHFEQSLGLVVGETYTLTYKDSADGNVYTQTAVATTRTWGNVSCTSLLLFSSPEEIYIEDGIYWNYRSGGWQLDGDSGTSIRNYRRNGFVILGLSGTGITSQKIYTISDNSITANSDIVFDITDDTSQGLALSSRAVGSFTLIRDSVPSSATPYTYKVKQTSGSGQFTLVNHFVPTTTVDQTYSASSTNAQSGVAVASALSGKLDATKCTYQTTAPTQAIADGGVHIVYLQAEPTTKYSGYIYMIAES